MSIDNDLQPIASITEGDRALDLFTDRYSFTRLLAERLNDPPRKEILFFHGAGGNGKSLLLKYLRTKVCKRLTAEQWQRVKPKKDDELAKAIEDLPATECLPVPTALLDFAPGANRRDSDPFYGLVRIREELAAATDGTPYRLRFPLHTYGCFLYLHQTNRLSEVDSLFPFEEAGLIKDFVELFQPLPGVGIGLSALGLVNKYSGDRLTHYKRRFGLDEAEVQRLQGMDAEAELILELPRLLAQDLNVAMAADKPDTPERIVLFFDTHEAFYGAERDYAKNFFRDGWLRRLLRRLDTESGIVVVVSGRDQPRWAEAGTHELNTQIPAEYVRLKSVDDLAESDAEIFLRRAGVEDAALRERLIRYASVEVGAVHPLHLGLCADVVLEAAAKGVALVPGDFAGVAAFQEKSAYLIGQLLKYVDEGLRDAIRALGACRAFDFEIYQVLGEALSFAVDRATFRRLVGFSFVRQVAQREDEWFRIHDLLRRLGDEPAVMQAHEILAAHYQEKREIEAIYHVNRLDWSQGISFWVGVFDEALKISHYELCRALLDLRQDLTIQTLFQLGRVSEVEGQYFQVLALYEAAKKAHREAISAYTLYLETGLDTTATLSNKGASLSRLAGLQVILSQHVEAQRSYELSIADFDAALHYDSKLVYALNSKGLALSGLANLQAKLSRNEQAQQNYKLSISACDAVLEIDSSSVQALNSKGLALSSLADLQMKLSQYAKAQQSYELAIATYDDAFACEPELLKALSNKGISLAKLANLQVMLFLLPQAQQNYKLSISVYDAILEKASHDVYALDNKGNSLTQLADLQAQLSQYGLAQQSYQLAISIYETLLKSAPRFMNALNNKSLALKGLASAQVQLSQYELAQQNYKESIATLDAIIESAPDYVSALNNKGNALMELATLQAQSSQYELAQQSCQGSISVFNEALRLSPGSAYALNNKGASQRSLAGLQAKLSIDKLVQQNYEASIITLNEALRSAPNSVPVLSNLGSALIDLGNFQAEQSEEAGAVKSWRSAMELFNRLLVIAPNNTQIRQLYEQLTQFLNNENE